MLALNPQERKRCSTIASALYEYENQILDLEPFTPANYRAPQRPSYGYQPVQYSQPPQQVVKAQSPVYYQQGQGPQPVIASHTSYQGQVVSRPVIQGHQSVPGSQAPLYHHHR